MGPDTVTDEASFHRILASLHEAALDSARWPGFSALVDEALGVQGTSMLFGGRGESTVRSHVKHMYTKHGLTRQADLVRLVRSLVDVDGIGLDTGDVLES